MSAVTLALLLCLVPGQESVAKPVLAPDAHLTTPVAGLERTRAEATIVDVAGQPFSRARRVVIRDRSNETNVTQLALLNSQPIAEGDTMLASFYLRGIAADGQRPGQVEFLFEKATDPWTKSVTRGIGVGRQWRRAFVAFRSAQSYRPGEAMASLRLAFGPQTIDIADAKITNYGKSRTLEQLVAFATSQSPIGTVPVAFNLKDTRQTMMGFGGNFCQPRYGATEPMDAVGEYVLKNLNVVHARIGLPLNAWNPEPGVYRDAAQANASLKALQILARRKLPLVASVWEAPQWMLPGRPEQMGRTLAPERYKDCIEAVAQYLVTARDKYGAHVDYFSFNEPDYGVNFKFTSAQMAEFIRQAGPRFAALGLKTKILVGDTANGSNFVGYAKPLLEDGSLAPYLGPIAFHSWDALSASESSYRGIAELGRKHRKAVWCLEAGHDAQLWQAKDPWRTWENALRNAMAYERTIRLTESSLMDYWTYQDNYPLVDKNGSKPYPIFTVMKQMEGVFTPGSRVALAKTSRPELQAIATVGKRNGFAALLINPEGPGKALLSGLPRNARVVVIRSDAEGQGRRSVATVNRQGRLEVALPMRSVVTVTAAR